ncbi:hypothetical protein Taro_009054 [Colocasia esculenta]|uniref:Uncharacterized protein n=1 Tax=Colocasia esculenta TaxID=4460 RepID=A0A843TVE0_COLES|nr:hypothetical protein [Colocasia esculenta]
MKKATGLQFATGSYEEGDRAVRTGREIATARSSHSERDGGAVATRPQNAAYRAIAFTGSAPESDRERACSWIAVQSCLILTQALDDGKTIPVKVLSKEQVGAPVVGDLNPIDLQDKSINSAPAIMEDVQISSSMGGVQDVPDPPVVIPGSAVADIVGCDDALMPSSSVQGVQLDDGFVPISGKIIGKPIGYPVGAPAEPPDPTHVHVSFVGKVCETRGCQNSYLFAQERLCQFFSTS